QLALAGDDRPAVQCDRDGIGVGFRLGDGLGCFAVVADLGGLRLVAVLHRRRDVGLAIGLANFRRARRIGAGVVGLGRARLVGAGVVVGSHVSHRPRGQR